MFDNSEHFFFYTWVVWNIFLYTTMYRNTEYHVLHFMSGMLLLCGIIKTRRLLILYAMFTNNWLLVASWTVSYLIILIINTNPQSQFNLRSGCAILHYL